MQEAINISNQIGYPVMLKASAGGGGKGIRVAYNEDELKKAYEVVKQEAAISSMMIVQSPGVLVSAPAMQTLCLSYTVRHMDCRHIRYL